MTGTGTIAYVGSMQPPVVWEDYNRELALDLAADGIPIPEIARQYGCDKRQFWRHLAMDAVFKESWNHARECAYFCTADSIPHIHEEFPEMSAHQWQVIGNARMWWLSKMYPSVFGDKLTIREEHVDLKGALVEARTRVITIQAQSQAAPSLDETQADSNRSTNPIKHLP